ncbi:MAG: S41 family peptidase [Planctomycetota bacterium]
MRSIIMLLLCLVPLRVVRCADEEPAPFPRMFPTIGQYLDRYYYDHSRIQPEVMVERGLRAAENGEVGLAFDWQDGQIALNVRGEVTGIEAPIPVDLSQAMRLLERVRESLRGNFDNARTRELAYAMANGALRTLDPHTVIYPPQPASDFEEDIQGEFYGIGAWLDEEDGVIRIERVMPGLPADKAGIHDGDIILKVDGERTVGLSLPQAVSRIKGPKETTVVLTVERADGEIKQIPIVRDLIPVPILKAYRHGDVGYVRMDEFNRQTANALRLAILNLVVEDPSPLVGFVLDLRFNSGGLLSQAEETSDFFLPPGKEIVRTVSKGKRDNVMMSGRELVLKTPMAVLIGPGSASAAEILAGALQRNRRAVVLGRPSFGKGSVQTVRSLRDGSHLKLTIQEYQLKEGISIQERGVVPDVELLRHSQGEDGSVDLLPYSLLRESDNEFALRARRDFESRTAYRLPWLQRHRTREQMRAHQLSSPEFTPDQEARLVLELMETAFGGADVEALSQRAEAALDEGRMSRFMLDALREPLRQRSVVETQGLAEAFAAQEPPIEWAAADLERSVDADQLSLAYTGPTRVTAGEEIELGFVVRNAGQAAVGQLFGVVVADEASPLWEDELVFGTVAAGGETAAALRFRVPPRSFSVDEHFVLRLYRGENPDPLAAVEVDLTIVGKPRPDFAYRWELIEPETSDDDKLLPDEAVTLRLHLMNQGTVASAPLTLFVFKNDDYFTELGEGRIKLAALEPGGSVSADIPLTVRSQVVVGRRTRILDRDAIELQIHVKERFDDGIDARYFAAFSHRLELPLRERLSGGTIRQPHIALQTVIAAADGRSAHIVATIEDDNPAYVALFHNDDKTRLTPHADLSAGRFEATVPLEEGINTIKIMASDTDEVSDIAYLRFWREPQTTARATPEPSADDPIGEVP